MSSRVRRSLALLPIAAILGLASTLALAWSGLTLGTSGKASEARWRGPGGQDWMFRLWPSPMQDVAVLSLESWSPGPGSPPTRDQLRSITALPHAAWQRLIEGSAPPAGSGAYWDLRAFGWPCRCMAAGSLTVLSAPPTTPLGSVNISFRGFGGTLPITPIWPGLLVNTAAFTPPWWLVLGGVWAAGGRIRSAHRRRRGLCAECGYDLRSGPIARCPECGRPI